MGCANSKDEPGTPNLEILKNENRKCTDIIWLIFFLVFLVAFVGIGIFALATGDPWRVVYASDYQGTTCDINKRGRYAYYPRLSEDLAEAVVNSGVTDFSSLSSDSINLFTLCMMECPARDTVVCKYDYIEPVKEGEVSVGGQKYIPSIDEIATQCGSYDDKLLNPICQDCWAVPLNSQGVLFRCLWEEASYTQTKEKCLSPNEETAANSTQCVSKEVIVETVTIKPAQENKVIESLSTFGGTLSRWAGDLRKSQFLILMVGILLAFVVAFCWLTILQWFAGFIIWTTLWLSVVASATCTIFAFYSSGYFTVESIAAAANKLASVTNSTIDIDSIISSYNSTLDLFESKLPESAMLEDGSETLYWKIAAWGGLFVTIVMLIVVLALSKHVAKAIGVLQEASKAVKDIPIVVLYPIITITFSIILIVWFMISSAAIMSLGSEETVEPLANENGTAFKTFQEGGYTTYGLFFNLFGFLWCINFIQGVGMMTIAGAIGQWYFTRPPSDGSTKDLPNSAVLAAFSRVFRFHLGSVAFGSFIVAVVQFLRAVLEYIDKQTQAAQEGNKLIAMVLCFMKCCMWCFEKCMKFLSNSAYVIVATRGKAFMPAACEAFSLIIANITTIGVLNIVSVLMMTMGKILITLICTAVGYQVITQDSRYKAATIYEVGGEFELSNKFVPVAMIAFSAFTVANTFLGIFSMAIDTIILCFCEDMKVYGSRSELYYMGEDLRDAMKLKGKAKLEDDPKVEDVEATEMDEKVLDVTGTV